nr:serine protease [uncultured Albidiferax sp.]
MKKLNFILIATGIFIGSNSQWANAADTLLTNMIGKYRGSTVFIKTTKETSTGEVIEEYGTGFIVSDQGHVLTSCHTVNRLILDDKGHDSKKVVAGITIKGATGSREEPQENLGFVACANPPIDLALLKFKNTFRLRKPIPLDRISKLQPGDSIASMGYPLDLDFLPRRGALGDSMDDDTYSVDMTLTFGDSGSPVFSERLFVVGVAEAGYAGTRIGFIRPIRHAAGLLSIAGIEITATNVDIPSTPAPNSPSGAKVEIADAPKKALTAFLNASSFVPASASEVKITYPFLKVFQKPTETNNNSSSREAPSIGISEIQAKPGYKIIDAKFISISQQEAEVINVGLLRGGLNARTTMVRSGKSDSNDVDPTVRGFIETTQVPLRKFNNME